jgi:hypothetical protein
VQIGREKGREEALRDTILEGVVRRFNPPAAEYRQLQQRLEAIHQPEALQQILLALFDAADTAVILTLVNGIEKDDS